MHQHFQRGPWVHLCSSARLFRVPWGSSVALLESRYQATPAKRAQLASSHPQTSPTYFAQGVSIPAPPSLASKIVCGEGLRQRVSLGFAGAGRGRSWFILRTRDCVLISASFFVEQNKICSILHHRAADAGKHSQYEQDS